jgi:hypothetical protein
MRILRSHRRDSHRSQLRQRACKYPHLHFLHLRYLSHRLPSGQFADRNDTRPAVPNGVIATLPNSDTNYLDDRLVWSNDINALSIDGKTTYCIPAKTRVLGRKSTSDTPTLARLSLDSK